MSERDDRPVSLEAVTAVFIAPYKGMAPEDGWLVYIRAALDALPTVAPATHGGREVTGEAMALATTRKAWLDAGSPDDGDDRRAFFSALLHFDVANGPVYTTPPKPSPAPKSVEEMAAEMGYTRCAHPVCGGYGNNTGECASEQTIIRLYAEGAAKPPAPVEMPAPAREWIGPDSWQVSSDTSDDTPTATCDDGCVPIGAWDLVGVGPTNMRHNGGPEDMDTVRVWKRPLRRVSA